ncbi:Putative peptide chain release factor class I [Septoria linicola]|uniref:Peptide chain release factor class I n=1 Tax=Septoria linicola TaxID=215465 RepID=A0A9Q9AW24_9PEZI|nr:putative peptide chain release factor class I [Septoria linicola]USW53007.1 Putative peptide chain release factor class I [Septoria linicola]
MFVGKLRSSNASVRSGFSYCMRAFSARPCVSEKPLPPRIVVPEKDMIESFLKGTGPGGQKINKTSSAVQLKHLPTGIVVKNQETRSREQNRRNARRLLGEKLEEMEKGSQARTAIKGEKIRKKKASAAKKSRRKYRQLDEEAASSVSETSSHEGHDIASTGKPSNGDNTRQNEHRQSAANADASLGRDSSNG